MPFPYIFNFPPLPFQISHFFPFFLAPLFPVGQQKFPGEKCQGALSAPWACYATAVCLSICPTINGVQTGIQVSESTISSNTTGTYTISVLKSTFSIPNLNKALALRNPKYIQIIITEKCFALHIGYYQFDLLFGFWQT